MSDAVERFDNVLRFAQERQISDVLLKPGQRPLYRRVGRLISRREEPSFDEGALAEVAARLLSPEEAKAFNGGASILNTYGLIGVGRFRVHVSRQRSGIAIAIRVLPGRPPALRDLRLPAPVASFCNVEVGLVLFVSGRGQGRSNTMAAIIDTINTTAATARQIATVESPIEVLYDDKLAWICQRAIGRDCDGVASGVRDALAGDADVIVIGDVDTYSALEAALDAAEAGKLVIAGLTALDIAQGLRRLYGLAPGDRVAAMRARLAAVLVGAMSQRLVISSDGQRRLPAVELMMASPQVYAIIRDGVDPSTTYDIMAGSGPMGMQTIDQSLHDMVQARAITGEAALAIAMRPQELGAIRKGSRGDSGLF